MAATSRFPLLSWTTIAPVLGVLLLVLAWGRELAPVLVALVAVVLAATVLAAVHHAEVVALRVGEPFGSLVLAVAVTIIEVALIVTLMVSGGPEAASLARDTVFAAVMITTNGIVGISLLLGALKHGTTLFNAEGSGGALATVITLATLTLVLPTFTTTTPGPEFSGPQLAFAALASLGLYGMFVFTQTVRHREYFLPDEDENPSAPPKRSIAWWSLLLLLVALVSVVGLAKTISPTIEDAVVRAGMPVSAVGVVIALLVLLPEGLAAVRASARGRFQTSVNLSYGSAMASIGLTIPTIAFASIWLDGPLVLGLGSTQIVLLAITVVVGALTVLPGRATLQEGGVHTVLFLAFVFLALNP